MEVRQHSTGGQVAAGRAWGVRDVGSTEEEVAQQGGGGGARHKPKATEQSNNPRSYSQRWQAHHKGRAAVIHNWYPSKGCSKNEKTLEMLAEVAVALYFEPSLQQVQQ